MNTWLRLIWPVSVQKCNIPTFPWKKVWEVWSEIYQINYYLLPFYFLVWGGGHSKCWFFFTGLPKRDQCEVEHRPTGDRGTEVVSFGRQQVESGLWFQVNNNKTLGQSLHVSDLNKVHVSTCRFNMCVIYSAALHPRCATQPFVYRLWRHPLTSLLWSKTSEGSFFP